MKNFRDAWDNFWFDYGFIFVILGLVVVMLVPIAGLVYTLDRTTCVKTADRYGVEADYGFWTGCLVYDEKNQFWTDINTYVTIRSR